MPSPYQRDPFDAPDYCLGCRRQIRGLELVEEVQLANRRGFVHPGCTPPELVVAPTVTSTWNPPVDHTVDALRYTTSPMTVISSTGFVHLEEPCMLRDCVITRNKLDHLIKTCVTHQRIRTKYRAEIAELKREVQTLKQEIKSRQTRLVPRMIKGKKA